MLEDEAAFPLYKRSEIEQSPPEGTGDEEYLLNVYAAKHFWHTKLDQCLEIEGIRTLPISEENRKVCGNYLVKQVTALTESDRILQMMVVC